MSDTVAALTDAGKFLLAAHKCRRPTCTDYIISFHADDMTKGSCSFVGKLRSVFCHFHDTISLYFYLSSQSESVKHSVNSILRRSNFFGTKFTVFDAQPPHAGSRMTKSRSTRLVNLKQVSPKVPAGNFPVAHVSYELNVLGTRYLAEPHTFHFLIEDIQDIFACLSWRIFDHM